MAPLSPPAALKVTFGIIVLNGEPFLPYCLRALYPFAHEILVVEGACEAARAIATEDGHSIDGTVEGLRAFQQAEDPEDKITLIQREGFWPEKDAMCQTFAEAATGNLLWQVDADEFYQPEEMAAVLKRLAEAPELQGASFQQRCYFGSFRHRVDGWFFWENQPEILRVFRWGKGFTYVDHRPPTVLDTAGNNLRQGPWLDAKSLAREGIFLYHYSYVLPRQVELKVQYYAAAEWNRDKNQVAWAEEAYTRLKRPFHLHPMPGYASWLEEDPLPAPPQVIQLQRALLREDSPFPLRETENLDRLVKNRRYRTLRFGMECWGRLRVLWFCIWMPRWKMIRRRVGLFYHVKICGHKLETR